MRWPPAPRSEGWLGRELEYRALADSTNTWASSLAQGGAPAGTVVVAEAQWKGRGREGRSWHSPAEVGLWCSLILRPESPSVPSAALGLVSALGVVEAAGMICGVEGGIKWPNDLLLRGRKWGGILVEASSRGERLDYAVVGIGLNVNQGESEFPADLAARATSLRMEAGSPVDRGELLAAVLARLERYYELFLREGLVPLAERIQVRDVLRTRRVRVRLGDRVVEGEARGMDDQGCLVLNTGRTEERLSTGTVEWVGRCQAP